MSTPTRRTAPARHAGPGPWGEWALLLLSAASGAADAFVFICVGQVFAGVMTGNLVLLGASAAGAGEQGVALRVITALVAYAVGVDCGAWMSERLRWSLPVMLLVEVVLLTAAAVLWALGLITSDGDRLGLLVLIAVAMGIQGRIRATPTNYFTGTLTALVGRAALRSWERGDHWVAGRLIAVVAGAAVTALTVRLWPDAAAVVAAVPAAGALLIETVRRRASAG
ncbi:YoaK family protein [Streptomyces sp. Wh19]|uniref:YoaK family protein n=1 Tax=Streptomyces sanglieri TaxID=193460 RepID=A0ABW2X977_9ACTN|nr:YoaK family protein [Streptomyces sp. Wh19]MDV9194727.1 YoaK family protein [Streptomyces sp. Wh19]